MFVLSLGLFGAGLVLSAIITMFMKLPHVSEGAAVAASVVLVVAAMSSWDFRNRRRADRRVAEWKAERQEAWRNETGRIDAS